MHLIVGLGNPGARYADTRHNAGFLVADVLARRAGASIDRDQCGAKIAKAQLGGHPIVLAKPQSFMNLSGGPTQQLRDFFKVEMARVVVVHDELDLPFGEVRVKVGGGHAGHNGLRDLIARVGADFVRVRVGIGRPPAGWEVADFVLARWSTEEASQVVDLVDDAANLVQTVLTEGVQRAQQAVGAPRRAASAAPSRIQLPRSGGPSTAS